jgi:hypothetical protein
LQESGYTPPSLPWIQCPADHAVDPAFPVPSYSINGGTRVLGITPDWNGIFRRYPKLLPVSEISDGQSNTALFSERLLPFSRVNEGLRDRERGPTRYLWHTLHSYLPGEDQEFASACASERTVADRKEGYAAVMAGVYSHLLTPNSPSCYNGPDSFDLDPSQAIRTASSAHPGGVHLLMCDGSGRFMSNSVDLLTWRALGTRNGSELVPEY